MRRGRQRVVLHGGAEAAHALRDDATRVHLVAPQQPRLGRAVLARRHRRRRRPHLVVRGFALLGLPPALLRRHIGSVDGCGDAEIGAPLSSHERSRSSPRLRSPVQVSTRSRRLGSREAKCRHSASEIRIPSPNPCQSGCTTSRASRSVPWGSDAERAPKLAWT